MTEIPDKIKEVIEKTAKRHSKYACQIYLPAELEGKKVYIVIPED